MTNTQWIVLFLSSVLFLSFKLYQRDLKIDRLEDEVSTLYSEVEYLEKSLESSKSYSAEQMMLTYAVFKECSICDEAERKEVAKTLLNRVSDDRFPPTLKGVLLQKGAVHAVNKFEMNNWVTTYKVVEEAFSEPRDEEIVGYYRPDTSTNKKWVDKVKNLVKVTHKYHKFHSL